MQGMDSGMEDKVVLITGGTGGIGKETAKGLAKLGARVIITGRNEKRGEAAVAEIQQESGNENVGLMTADLSSQTEIRRLADEFEKNNSRLDVLINNVGGLYRKRWLTVDGIEATFAINALAPFLLTRELLPLLRATAPARVMFVTGGMPGRIDLENLQAEKGHLGLRTYSHAKAAMMALAFEQAWRLEGTGVSANVAYPGAAYTDMTKAMTPDMFPGVMRVLWPVFRFFMGNAKPEKAARSSIYLASSPEVADINGVYFNTNSKKSRWPRDVLDDRKRLSLWETAERLTGLVLQQQGLKL